MLDHLHDYQILIEKLQAVAAATNRPISNEEETLIRMAVMRYIKHGAPYGLDVIGFAFWVDEQTEGKHACAAPLVLSA